MTEAAADRLVFAAQSSRGLNRAITVSLVVHVCIIAFLAFAPREWFSRDKKDSTTMVISLSGSPGPRTGGFAPLGGQPVEKVAPPPKRPEPTPVAAAKPTPAASTVTAVKPPPKTDSKAPPSAVTNPPITGREITAGTSKAATGVTGEGTGLSQGGGGGSAVEVDNFCCWPYIDELRNRILPHWDQNQQQKGQTVLRFEIARDGKLLHWEYYERSPSGILDRAAMSALKKAEFPPLPKEFTGQTLKIRLTFVYKGP